jgi:hypothetical protein
LGILFSLGSTAIVVRGGEIASKGSPWRVLIANDTCPDVTWGFPEPEVRRSLAGLIRAHLDEMKRTDGWPAESRNHYNVMAFFEVESFFEEYPERKEEFIRRVREGRICVGPFLCNTMWAFQSVEGALRAFYPARRFERATGTALETANHTELPSLPWGMATLLSGCGFRWTSVPFLDYDSTLKGLRNPPLFRLAGPDGGEVRVILDAWASQKANYMQGGYLLQDPKRVTAEWVPRYESLGAAYPLRTIYASGTHSDINPNSWKQARGFADAIAAYNKAGTNSVQLLNGTLAQFCREVDAAEQAAPFLPKLRGCLGHSWDLWPVSLARTVAAARENERAYLAAEALAALASRSTPNFANGTRADRERAEWCWAMLGDHAWNGTDANNKRHNAELRRTWAGQLRLASERLSRQAWRELGLKTNSLYITVFNPLSFTNDVLVDCEAPDHVTGLRGVPSSLRTQAGGTHLRFVAPRVPPFGFREFRLETRRAHVRAVSPFSAGQDTLEGPFYRLRVDPANGGLASLMHKPTGRELVRDDAGRSMCQTVYHQDGRERVLSDISCDTRFDGCTGQLRITGGIGATRVTNTVTLHAALDQVDFDVRIEKPPATNEQRLLHFFPVAGDLKDLHVETTAAVLRPCPQPEGDLLPGANTWRFAVQGFVDASPPGKVGVTIAPLDAYLLRLDQGALAFEPLGNDQNWKEVTRDQNGERHFRFRYSLRAHSPGYDNAAAVAWSRSAAAPATVAIGRLPKKWLNRPQLELDPARGLVTCLKPADDPLSGGIVARLWETSGQNTPVVLRAPGFRRAGAADLLERERGALDLRGGRVIVPVRGFGFAGVALH